MNEEQEKRMARSALYVSVIAAVFTGFQWWEARGARTDAQEAVIAAQRPYLGIDAVSLTYEKATRKKPGAPSAEHEPSGIKIVTRIYGNSPALNVHAEINCSVYSVRSKLVADEPPLLPGLLRTYICGSTDLNEPAENVSLSTPDPGGALSSLQSQVAVVGHIDYQDLHKNQFGFDICFQAPSQRSMAKESTSLVPCNQKDGPLKYRDLPNQDDLDRPKPDGGR